MNPIALPFSLEQVQLATLVLVRVGALLFTVPVLGANDVPLRAKAGLTLMLTILLLPLVPMPAGLAQLSLVALLPVMLHEILIGVAIGLTARFIFEGVQIGGQLVGFQMGFGIVNVFDPITGANFSIIAQLQNLFATLLFLGLGVHHWFIRVMAASFDSMPLLQARLSPAGVQQLLDMSSDIFLIGIKIAAPIMTVLLATSLLMGIINKGAQGMNVMIVMFPLKIAIGLCAVGFGLPLFYYLLQRIFNQLGPAMFRLMELCHG